MYKNALPNFSAKHNTALFLMASASAEFFADMFLCPWEAVSIFLFEYKINVFYSLKSDNKHLPSPLNSLRVQWPSSRMKECTDSIRVLFPYGSDKFHTPWWNSQSSRISLVLSTNTYSQLENHTIQSQPNFQLHSLQDTWPVFSALLFLTLLILWSQSSIKNQALAQPVMPLKLFTRRLDSRDYGTV